MLQSTDQIKLMKNRFIKRILDSRNIITITVAALTFAVSPLLLLSLGSLNTTKADNSVMGSNFFLVGNNTVPGPAPAHSTNANPENVVEFFIRIRNIGDETAKDVQVQASLPSESSTTLVTSAFIRPNNRDRVNVQVQDTAVVNVLGGQPVGLRLFPGHSRLSGVTNLFNCPNTCDIPDSVPNQGLDVGDVPAGQEVQVSFKAALTQAVQPTPTPSPTP
jgi:uncharacterized repeat protein (TIGR01451 family)